MSTSPAIPTLTRTQRYVVLAAAFLGWMFAGVQLGMFVAARPAVVSFLRESLTGAELNAQAGKWSGYYICAFLFGAATGGWLFGWMGDLIGRAKTIGITVIWYSLFTGAAYFATSLEQFILLRFVACLGVGGMWPNGVALASEAWSDGSRPLLAGLIGTAANVGLAITGAVSSWRPITPDDWRWFMLFGATPVVLGFIVLAVVPESPHWLATRNLQSNGQAALVPMSAVFRSPFLRRTIVGILLGTVPLLGSWGSVNWLTFWADQVGGADNANLKGKVQFMRSSGAAVGSLFGGVLATMLGRRITYFLLSLASLLTSGYVFWFLTPDSESFLMWAFILGLVITIVFGWLPLYLPELYPTRVRATGSGVTFNFGRILAAFGTLGTSWLIAAFHEDYAQVGRITSLVYAFGMLVVLFAPDTSQRKLTDDE